MRRLSWLLFLMVLVIPARAQERFPHQALQFGIRVGPQAWSDLEGALAVAPSDPANPVGVSLVLPADWTRHPDWPALDRVVSSVAKAQARLGIATEIPGEADQPETLEYLAELSTHVGDDADMLSLSLNRDEFPQVLRESPDQMALTLKRMISALRGRSGAKVLIGEVAAEDLPLMDPLYDRDFRAYVEGYCSMATGATGEPDDDVVRFLQSHHLGAPLLIHLPKVSTPIAAELLILLSASRGVTFVDVEPTGVAETWKALLDFRSHLSPQMGPGFSVMATQVSDASGPRGDVAIINLLDADRMVQGMALVPMISGSKAAELDVELPTADISDPEAFPMPSGEKRALGYTADQKRQVTTLRVPWQGKAMLLLFSRLKTGTVGEDRVSVTGVYRIPVEVILARHQAMQQPQTIFLDNYKADARVDYHFKLPGGTGSLDVTFLNTFLFEKGTGARWVQNQMLLNGVAWKGKKIPELPIIEPEKVNTLPLSLTLGRDYSYRYIKDETVDGHDCYEVEFLPLPQAKGSLYSGRVWIDKTTYAKIKMSVRQTDLTPPQVSNDETDTYAPFQGPEGHTYWLLQKLEGQQIFSVGGQNVVAERFITFGEPSINDPSFKAEVAKAEASDKPILQDTDKGLRYLEKEPDGSRRLRMDEKTNRWLAVAGTYYDQSLDYPLPLVGVNYFDYNWRKTGTQVNLFLAGAVNTLTLSKVDVLPKVDASFNAVGFLLSTQDRYYPQGEEDKAQRIKVLREFANGGLGWRFTEMSKLSLDLDLLYYRYTDVSQTAPGFRLPKNHLDMGLGLNYSWSRRGWSLTAGYEGHRRSAWEPWGMPGENKNAKDFKDYALWEGSFSKAFYLPAFQKITTSLSWLDGKDLDRFSQYQFSYLGKESLSGFTGSGVRFDRGGIARVGYEFNVANVVRFGLTAEQARVQPVRGEGLWQNHTGLGLNGAVAGPWQTFWTLDLGYALRSDIGPVEHKYTAALVVLKLW